MTVKMPHPKQNRKSRNTPSPVVEQTARTKFTVYAYESATDEIVSEGTYHNDKEAKAWMEKILSTGQCAWMVSHGG